jgi:hypothetical protein
VERQGFLARQNRWAVKGGLQIENRRLASRLKSSFAKARIESGSEQADANHSRLEACGTRRAGSPPYN